MKTLSSYFMLKAGEENRDSSSLLILVIISLSCLLPFLNRAFHMDDPMYLWAARHIQSNPFDFYGFTVNWDDLARPMFSVMKNPPFASYYIAIVSSLFGWAEITLHTAFLIPAVAAVIGTYYLAKEFCSTPLLATLIGILSPVFILSSTTVMSDIMMLSFWVWAAFFWIQGIKSNSKLSLLCAALLIAFCGLTKYFGMSIIPLLFVYSLIKERKLGKLTLFLVIPVIILAAYQWATIILYGRGLLLDASSYALNHQAIEGGQLFAKSVTGLFFAGGCYIAVLFYSFFLWTRRTLAAGGFLAILVVLLYLLMQGPNGVYSSKDDGLNWLFIFQCCLFSMSGMGILFLAASDLRRDKDADSLFLFLWIMGTFIFGSFLNWSVNGRSVLPMFPAIGILILRRLEASRGHDNVLRAKYIFIPLVPSLLIALSVTWADYEWADTARKAALDISHRYVNNQNTVWFQGHWGFQYYMEENSAKALNMNKSNILRGDIVITPSDNSNMFPLPEKKFFNLVEVYKISPNRWLSTLSTSTGAGFYSSRWGPLPFVVGSAPESEYAILQCFD
jgi:4-amino-4-deoxy-L-arabinose transferase-like glycosyltransferase